MFGNRNNIYSPIDVIVDITDSFPSIFQLSFVLQKTDRHFSEMLWFVAKSHQVRAHFSRIFIQGGPETIA